MNSKKNCLKAAKNNRFSQKMHVLMQNRSRKKATNQTVPIYENNFDYSIGFDCSISMHVREKLSYMDDQRE